MSILDKLPSRKPYVRATTDRELIVQRPYRADRHQSQFFANSATPETALETPTYTNPNQRAEPDPDCTCPALDLGGNPTCTLHGWWNRDDAVLDLADLTRELGSSWEAAQRIAAKTNQEAE